MRHLVNVCVRQSGVTKQQAWTQPQGSIIENTDAYTPALTLNASLQLT